MNTEDFVTYEQSLSLKKLGFDRRCTHYYLPDGFLKEVEPKNFGMYGISYDFNYEEGNGCVDFEELTSAPTLAQAQKWLKEKKNWHVYATPTLNSKYDKKYKWIRVNWDCIDENEESNYPYDRYEEALSEGITECLKLIEDDDTRSV